MSHSGYVRFGVASAAALSLHALLFLTFHIPQTENSVEISPPLQLSILQQHHKTQKAQTVSHEKLQTGSQPKAITTPTVDESTVAAQEEPRQSEAAKAEQVIHEQEDESMSEPLQLPDVVQSAILAKVIYPRQARRFGWQGEAELRFLISSQVVQEIRLFVSTGFPLLDQAAFKGLASISTMPLADGSYRLPVLFRLE